MPNYEEAISQSLKQPPPPYCQVVIANNPNGAREHSVTTANVASSSSAMSNASTAGLTVVANSVNSIGRPPIYREDDNTEAVASTSAQVTTSEPKNDTVDAPQQSSSAPQ